MPFEKNPSIPPPPPPPGPKKMEVKEATGLTEVEKVLFKNSAEYGNLTPEQAQMTPKLREILENFRKDRLFAVEVYALTGGRDGHPGGATYDTNAIKCDVGGLYEDIAPESTGTNSGPQRMAYIRNLKVGETLAFVPLQKRDKRMVEKVVRPAGFLRKEITEQVAEYSPPRPTLFQEALPTCPPEVAKDPLVRITYHASDPSDFNRYPTPIAADVSWRKTQDKATQRPPYMYMPEQSSSQPGENINQHMQDILQVKKLPREKLYGNTQSSLRPNNEIAITVMLPQSRAKELWEHFQKNPEYVRPFFIAGAEDLMPLHLPPPYKEWDEELPNKPVLFREFDGNKKEVNKAVIPVTNMAK